MSLPVPTTSAAEGSEPTRNFQHYEVLRHPDGSPWELGRGTMGITYKAFDVNLCCEVALKVVNAALLDSVSARERFVREAKAAASLRHRNVASVYHLGNDGERFFYAMEFIDGETLDALVRRQGPLPVATTLRLILQTVRALAAAGRQNLVHRDIKPANIMVAHEDADDHMVVKVIDFGLARPVSGESGGSSGQLTAGGFVGTPQFASPEQLEEKPLDARSDIYSLGVTTWFLLTGRAPFTGSLATICHQHLTALPPWEKLPGSLPEPMRGLLAHMLEKDPARRPQNAVELRREIEECVAAVKGRAVAGVDASFTRGAESARPRRQAGESIALSGWEGGKDDAGSIVDRLTLVSGEPSSLGRWLFGIAAAVAVFVGVIAGVWIVLAQRLPGRPAAMLSPPAVAPSRLSSHPPAATPRPTVPPPLPKQKTRALLSNPPVNGLLTPAPAAPLGLIPEADSRPPSTPGHGSHPRREIPVLPAVPVEPRAGDASPAPDLTPTPRPEPEIRRALPPLTPFDPDATPTPQDSPGGT